MQKYFLVSLSLQLLKCSYFKEMISDYRFRFSIEAKVMVQMLFFKDSVLLCNLRWP